MPFRLSRLRPASALAPALALSLALLMAGSASAAPQPSTYEFVDLAGRSHVASSLVFTPDGVRASLPDGVRHIPGAEMDWYETFYRNIRAGATNVIAFRTGSLLRFDKLELKGGMVTLTTSGGGQVTLTESLVDFEGSVREGAMVRLPEGTGAVQVSASSGGAWSPEDGGAAVEETPASRRRSAASRRRSGSAAPGPMVPADGGTEAASSEEDPRWSAPEETQTEKTEETKSGNVPRSTFPRRGLPGQPEEKPTTEETDGQATGTAVVSIATDYSGGIGGLQLQLQYPPNLQVVDQVALSGFASNWLATPNSTVPGQIAIGGAAPSGTSISGGEFFRVTFVWTGQRPAQQLFRIGQMIAVGENSESLGDFRTTMSVEITP